MRASLWCSSVQGSGSFPGEYPPADEGDPPAVPVTAFLAVDTRDELLFEDELRLLVQDDSQVNLHLFIYQEDGVYYTPELFSERLEDPAHARYFICSSPKVRDIVLPALASLGVPSSAIEFEAFSY